MFGGRIGLPELTILLVIVGAVILTIKKGRGRSVGAAVVGAFLGGLIGFLLRPAVPLVGQLPFETVITRGTSLSGLDVVLRSAAEQSFNYMLIGTIIGAVVLGIWGRVREMRQSPTAKS